MRTLLQHSRENLTQDVIGKHVGLEGVHGIVLDYHPLWLLAWQWRAAFGEQAANDTLYRIYPLYGAGASAALEFWDSWTLFRSAPVYFPPPDIAWRPAWWNEIVEGKDKLLPLVFRIRIEPGAKISENYQRADFPAFVTFERRPIARLCNAKRQMRPLVGGLGIGTGPVLTGTLGGIVQDQHGKQWGVTCAHVAAGSPIDQPGLRDHGSAAPIATRTRRNTLHPSPAHTTCNPYNPGTVFSPLDVALLDLITAADMSVRKLGRLTGIMPRMNVPAGDKCEMVGKETEEPRPLRIGGLAVTYRFQDDAQQLYCFKDLFELRTINPGQGEPRPVFDGDSGAWVITQGAGGAQWAGMAMGGDPEIGYALFSEDIQEWAQKYHQLHLRVS